MNPRVVKKNKKRGRTWYIRQFVPKKDTNCVSTHDKLSYVYIDEFMQMTGFLKTPDDIIELSKKNNKYYKYTPMFGGATAGDSIVYDRTIHIARTALHEMCHQILSKSNHSNEGHLTELADQYQIEEIQKLNDSNRFSSKESVRFYVFRLLHDWGFVLYEKQEFDLMRKGESNRPHFPFVGTNISCVKLLSIDAFIVSFFFKYALTIDEIIDIVNPLKNYVLNAKDGRLYFLKQLKKRYPLQIEVKDNYNTISKKIN